MITKRKKETYQASYKIVQEEEGLYSLHRNERPLMSPAGRPYKMPQEKLATSIKEEWEAQTDKIVPATMPLTQLMATTLDIVGKDKEKTQKGLVAYVPTELLCYRAEKPEALIEKQNTIWQSYLDWCADSFGVQYNIGLGLMPIAQEDTTTQKMEAVINSYDDMMLTALSSATDCTGSLVLGLALVEQFKPAAAIFEACELDATDQAVRWGDDPVTQERHKNMIFELEACERWIGLVKG